MPLSSSTASLCGVAENDSALKTLFYNSVVSRHIQLSYTPNSKCRIFGSETIHVWQRAKFANAFNKLLEAANAVEASDCKGSSNPLNQHVKFIISTLYAVAFEFDVRVTRALMSLLLSDSGVYYRSSHANLIAHNLLIWQYEHQRNTTSLAPLASFYDLPYLTEHHLALFHTVRVLYCTHNHF